MKSELAQKLVDKAWQVNTPKPIIIQLFMLLTFFFHFSKILLYYKLICAQPGGGQMSGFKVANHIQWALLMVPTACNIQIRYVDGTPTSEVTPVTIWYIHPPHHGHTNVNIMVMNGWLTSLSFHVSQPHHSWDKAISNSDLETWRSRSWVWSMGKVIRSAQYLINLLPFHFT